MSQPQLLLCLCQHARLLDRRQVELAIAALRQAGLPFTAVPDLCELAANRDPRLAEFAAHGRAVAACFPRAVRALFHLAGAELGAQAAVLNLRTRSAAAALAELGLAVDESAASIVTKASCSSAPGVPRPRPLQREAELSAGETLAPNEAETASTHSQHTDAGELWIPWFPVIDYGRCANCMQCRGFCLFGVYGVDAAGRVEVQNPRQCKTNCPACARVCPRAAIMFPKYADAPINGDEVREEDLRSQKMQTNLREALDGDLHETLKRRGMDPDALKAAAAGSHSLSPGVLMSLNVRQPGQAAPGPAGDPERSSGAAKS